MRSAYLRPKTRPKMSKPTWFLTDGWHVDSWLFPCDRCGSTKYGVRAPRLYCDQCITQQDIDSQDTYADYYP